MEPAAVGPDAPDFWKEVASTPGGESIATCIQCNTCTSTCPVEALEPNLDVRRTIARVKAGLREDVLSDNAIWACTRCFACVATCPKHARPGEILEALRHLSLKAGAEGHGPRHMLAFVKSVRENGRIHEARVTMESLGFKGLLKEGLLPLEMAWRGKAPSLRPRRLKSVTEVKRIIAAAEASR